MEQLQVFRSRRLWLGVLSVAIVFAAYICITSRPDNNPALLPPISDILKSFHTNLTSGSLLAALGPPAIGVFMAWQLRRDLFDDGDGKRSRTAGSMAVSMAMRAWRRTPRPARRPGSSATTLTRDCPAQPDRSGRPRLS